MKINTTKIVAMTQPLIEGIQTADEFLAYTARVSNPSNQMNTETAHKLIKYLLKHKHFSPFEMVSVTMEVVTTRDIARQILRHRSFSFQEFSQRYADPTQDLGFVTRETRLQDKKNRQNSIATDDDQLKSHWNAYQQQVKIVAEECYKWAIENGIAKEQARSVLPEGLTVSRLYMTGNLRSWLHYSELRMGPETQKEHREVAQSAWSEILKYFPSLQE